LLIICEAGRASSTAFDAVFIHLTAERIPVDAQRFGRFGETAFAVPEDPGDEPLLELVNGVVELHAALNHFLDQLLESLTNHAARYSSSRPVSRRNASRYFS